MRMVPEMRNHYPKLYKTEWLVQKYIVEKRSLSEIAKIVGCSMSTVHLAMVRNGIPRRSQGVQRKVTEKGVEQNDNAN
jgi:hypothetical protein